MSLHNETAIKVAEYLLQIKAIKLQPDNPFTWTSGWKSPIYCDNRVSLSHPMVRTYIRQQLTHLINEEFGPVGAIAGVATAGIPQGVLVAQELGLPFAYVRAEAKKHGMNNQIEGELKHGDRIIVIEDLISTGKSSLAAVEALRAAGHDVVGLVSIFNYGFTQTEEAFKEAKCVFHSLSNYNFLIDEALKNGYINKGHLETLVAWRENPSTWGQ
ncbi:orotate phosphoribosyltransferase [Solitalea koreensis]|uniref:Orotate phosphoribosyltransferase n=1 Tax=Solitalea koreensis TaxID=543615 RepID=A0A521D4I4_9SPHI|nr:orotate phosphoribosyltransferase [Solitalea koreensis]SMO65800.1 orotate phosphoribosyltransferase [Solitalea koreensis]